MQQKRAGVTQQSSLKTMARRVLVLAATAAALRPTLPRRSRTAPRAAMTMHDYDYDVRDPVPKSNCGTSPPLLNHGLHAIDATPARRRGGVVSHGSF